MNNEQRITKQKMIQEGKELFNKFVAEIFQEYSNLYLVVIFGYTLGFNDEYPCIHSSYTLVSKKDLEDSGLDNRGDNNSTLSYTDSKKIKDQFDCFGEILENIYGTGWKLIITRSEGAFKIEDEKYDCYA